MKHLKIEQGPEYYGETYIWCIGCAPHFGPQRDFQDPHGVFEGETLDELMEFIHEHEDHTDTDTPEVRKEKLHAILLKHMHKVTEEET